MAVPATVDSEWAAKAVLSSLQRGSPCRAPLPEGVYMEDRPAGKAGFSGNCEVAAQGGYFSYRPSLETGRALQWKGTYLRWEWSLWRRGLFMQKCVPQGVEPRLLRCF